MISRLFRLALLLWAAAWPAAGTAADDWTEVLSAARGQTVYWNAWGGDERTNAFIAWAGAELEARHGIRVVHVKLSDTADAVNHVLAEKTAGVDSGGSVDLIWINGGNFQTMKDGGLLYGPFVAGLPNARYLDLRPGSAAATDFTVPVEGYESPWRLARFVLIHDSARVADPPRTMADLSAWATAHPGRFTHPSVQNFMGATFLKQALAELAPDPAVLTAPPDQATFDAATAPLWAWYDGLRPNLWRGGRTFPENESVQQQLLADGEVDFAMALDPGAAAAAVSKGLLPDSVRTYGPKAGSIGNVSFVAIPFNATAREGALVLADFLIDPAVQARAQDVRVLGAYSVLDPGRLDAAQRDALAALPSHPALPAPGDLGPVLAEPHPEWMRRLAEEWARRYTP